MNRAKLQYQAHPINKSGVDPFFFVFAFFSLVQDTPFYIALKIQYD